MSDSEDQQVSRWKGMFKSALEKVQAQVHTSLTAEGDALDYVESLIIQLLESLCANQPHTVVDIEDRVKKTFPNPIDQWAINDANTSVEKGKKKSPLVLPVDKIHSSLKEMLGYRVDSQVSLWLVAVLEYIAADILKLAGNYVKNIGHTAISCQDIKVAMCADKVLMEMFHQDEEEVSVSSLLEEELDEKLVPKATFDVLAKDLIAEEVKFIRDLGLIIKVFRKRFIDSPSLFSEDDVKSIFGNIMDLYQLTVSFRGLLEDALEMMDEVSVCPAIGECFEDMAEAEEFEVYIPYATHVLNVEWRSNLQRLLTRPEVAEYFKQSNGNFLDAVTYVMPRLLLEPIYHCLHYFESLKALLKAAPNEEEQENIRQASTALKTVEADLERVCNGVLPKRRPGDTSLRFNRRSRQSCIGKMNEIQHNIEGWEGKDISQVCNEFIMEGNLGKIYTTKKATTERHIFLFDGMLVCCKLNTRRSVTGSSPEYRLKEKYYLRRITLADKENIEDLHHAFEITVKGQQPQSIVFFAKSAEEKTNWMESLSTLLYRSTLERMLDTILKDEEANQPLRLPSASVYRFAVEDSPENIVFEEGQVSKEGAPLIKGGTLEKLIERLTYHRYVDPSFVRTFLTTYRSFCEPHDLLSLLIDRFEIPEPPPTEEDKIAIDQGITVVREDLKRFRKEYARPVQLRVLNVCRKWVDQHFYDFERDPELLNRLLDFFETVRGKALKKWVDSIHKVIQRRKTVEDAKTFNFETKPPPIEWHIARKIEDFDLLTLHPIEIARQVTLLESDLYRKVKPSELVGSVWTKPDKKKTSPNLLKMIHHTNMFIMWLEKTIVETENFEERLAVVGRIIEVMMVFQELNNFNGVLEIVSAIGSAAVFRLEHVFRELHQRKKQALDESQELNQDHYRRYSEKLRSVNPPCVPFFGMYLSNILFIEEGNPDFLPCQNCGTKLINFSKRRKVAEITAEIQQFQNQPYCLLVEPEIRKFFENLDPLQSMTPQEFENMLYNKSLEVEPRNCKQLPKFGRRFSYSLKSPGIKPSSERHRHKGPGSLTGDRSSVNHKSHDDEVTSPIVATPPSPRTPTTPIETPSESFADHFIMIGSETASRPTSTLSTSSQNGNTPSDPPPPPLPPRRKNPGPGKDLPPPQLPPKPDRNRPPVPPRSVMSSSALYPQEEHIPAVPPKTYKKSQQYQNELARRASQSASNRREPPPPLPPPLAPLPLMDDQRLPPTPAVNLSFHIGHPTTSHFQRFQSHPSSDDPVQPALEAGNNIPFTGSTPPIPPMDYNQSQNGLRREFMTAREHPQLSAADIRFFETR